MARVSLDFVIEQIRKKQMPYWTISDGSVIDEFDEANTEESIIQLKYCLDQIEPGVLVTIKLKAKSKSKIAEGGDIKNNFEYRVLTGSPKEIKSLGAMVTDNSALLSNYQDIANQLAEYKAKEQNKALLDRIQALEDELDEDDEDEPMTGIESSLTPYMPQIMESLFGVKKPTALAGVQEPQTIVVEESTSTPDHIADQKKKCAIACGRLLRKDGSAGDNLLMLAELLERNEAMYKMGISFIENQLPK